MWAALVRFIVSNEERTIRRRRLVLGIVVLLLVDVIWVGSAELMEVSIWAVPAEDRCRLRFVIVRVKLIQARAVGI